MNKLRHITEVYDEDDLYFGVADQPVIDMDHFILCMDLESLYYQLTNEELQILKKIRDKYL